MRRVAIVLLALALSAVAVVSAFAQEFTKVFSTAYYSLKLPTDWIVDTGSLWDDEDYQELGVLEAAGDPALVIECAVMGDVDPEDAVLWSSDERGLEKYLEEIMDELEDDNPRQIDTLMAGDVPILLIGAEDDEGPYFCANTVLGEREMVFLSYVANADSDHTLEPSEADLALLKQILLSLKPIQ